MEKKLGGYLPRSTHHCLVVFEHASDSGRPQREHLKGRKEGLLYAGNMQDEFPS